MYALVPITTEWVAWSHCFKDLLTHSKARGRVGQYRLYNY